MCFSSAGVFDFLNVTGYSIDHNILTGSNFCRSQIWASKFDFLINRKVAFTLWSPQAQFGFPHALYQSTEKASNFTMAWESEKYG